MCYSFQAITPNSLFDSYGTTFGLGKNIQAVKIMVAGDGSNGNAKIIDPWFEFCAKTCPSDVCTTLPPFKVSMVEISALFGTVYQSLSIMCTVRHATLYQLDISI